VAVVTVSYNTEELTALLLWSVSRLLDWDDLQVLVVDNGSTDGSPRLLSALAEAGVCSVILNDANLHHGPALNMALSWLAAQPEPCRRVWLLDSDCVIARPDALREAMAVAPGAAVVGEPQWDPWHQIARFGTYSILLDPARVWQPEIGPFDEGGDPAYPILDRVRQQRLETASFGFTHDGYVIHRGRGSLAALVEKDERSNPLFEWAAEHHAAHFNLVPGAQARWNELRDRFRDAVPTLDPATLVRALVS
jgi:glycosyltransferase involved in cell wall biosynthesis